MQCLIWPLLCTIWDTPADLGDIKRTRELLAEAMAVYQSEQNSPGMAESLIGFAALAVVQGVPSAAARLLAAATAIGERHAKSSWAVMRMEYDYYLTLVRAKFTETSSRRSRQVAGSSP